MRAHILVIGLVVIIIVSVIALNVSFHRTLVQEMAEQFNKQQLLLARAEASDIKAVVDRVKDEVFRIAELVSLLRIRDETLYEILATGFLNDVRNAKMGINFLNSEGKALFTKGNWTIDSPGNQDFAWKAFKMSCPGEVLVRQNANRVLIVQAVCHLGSVAGAIVTSLDIQHLAGEFLDPISSGSRGNAWMMDGSGTLLYHPTQPDMVGRNLYRTDTSCFECHQSFDLEKKVIEGRGDYHGKFVSPSGEDKVLAFSTVDIGNSRWIVAVSAPYSEVTKGMHRSRKFHSWIIFLILLTTSVGATLLTFVNRKRVAAEERAKNQTELEQHAEDLERKVEVRTKELTAEKEKLNTVVSTIGSGIILVDNHRKILWINETMKNIAGEDITGMLCDDFFSDCTIIGSYKANDVQTDILSNLFGQSDKYFQVTTAPVKGEDEGVHGFIRLVHDVTEMKKMEEQMIDSEKLALLGRLTEGIAQEIGNPLTSVVSFVQMLKEMENDEFKKESLETIDFNMNRISDILKQLSGFSKMPLVELKQWKVSSLLEYSLSLIQYDPRVKDITIVRDLMSGMPDILTDGNQLSQVIVNIILNATDAMPDGGTLTIRSKVTDGYIVIAFEDRGVGIPSENLDRIFEPFYTTKEQGTGLGLSVSQSIVKKLNGSLTVESELNKGSVFTITLPLNVAG